MDYGKRLAGFVKETPIRIGALIRWVSRVVVPDNSTFGIGRRTIEDGTRFSAVTGCTVSDDSTGNASTIFLQPQLHIM